MNAYLVEAHYTDERAAFTMQGQCAECGADLVAQGYSRTCEGVEFCSWKCAGLVMGRGKAMAAAEVEYLREQNGRELTKHLIGSVTLSGGAELADYLQCGPLLESTPSGQYLTLRKLSHVSWYTIGYKACPQCDREIGHHTIVYGYESNEIKLQCS